jgi:hypothetical protein
LVVPGVRYTGVEFDAFYRAQRDGLVRLCYLTGDDSPRPPVVSQVVNGSDGNERSREQAPGCGTSGISSPTERRAFWDTCSPQGGLGR